MAEIISKALTLFLLLSIIDLNHGSARLICWKCDPCPEHDRSQSYSTSIAHCTSSQTICVKNTMRIRFQPPKISKGCVKTCTPSSTSFLGEGISVDCCNTTLCNLSTKNQLSLSIYVYLIIVFTIMFNN
ncbi:unnamed protein product [Rotaria magnacalcarata]|uniref:Snake toxin/toxin-like domain-containing protein n=1 Tax=Rotaria magnacalcarata TaxID=392030 RepID=A0A814MDZ6_9BILA|nr:unnamed protein product [Rotaria magnacalcarata]CAF1482917.1 unnamed protein product [Rotaria magnacalcarata]CAF2089685.1 unnamed protein product [Rotaria magnacalcarata]CAF3907624.1 unnamed protein product [Rotaria magnacalcarata]CAF4026927.1 unnamed protein product [Rotaria magnacalcarata]